MNIINQILFFIVLALAHLFWIGLSEFFSQFLSKVIYKNENSSLCGFIISFYKKINIYEINLFCLLVAANFIIFSQVELGQVPSFLIFIFALIILNSTLKLNVSNGFNLIKKFFLTNVLISFSLFSFLVLNYQSIDSIFFSLFTVFCILFAWGNVFDYIDSPVSSSLLFPTFFIQLLYLGPNSLSESELLACLLLAAIFNILLNNILRKYKNLFIEKSSSLLMIVFVASIFYVSIGEII